MICRLFIVALLVTTPIGCDTFREVNEAKDSDAKARGELIVAVADENAAKLDVAARALALAEAETAAAKARLAALEDVTKAAEAQAAEEVRLRVEVEATASRQRLAIAEEKRKLEESEAALERAKLEAARARAEAQIRAIEDPATGISSAVPVWGGLIALAITTVAGFMRASVNKEKAAKTKRGALSIAKSVEALKSAGMLDTGDKKVAEILDAVQTPEGKSIVDESQGRAVLPAA